VSDSGQLIRMLRQERHLKPSDIERLSGSVASSKANPDFYISHATLADVEAGSVPSIYKIFSLAVCFKMSYAELLLSFGVDPHETEKFLQTEPPTATTLEPSGLLEPAAQFRLHFDTRINLRETGILPPQPETWGSLPAALIKRLEPRRFTYAAIGLEDDTMADIIPPGSLVEIDKEQNTVEMFMWHALRERPIYLVWHDEGYTCSWCQQDGNELMLIPHPASARPVIKFKLPREATVIGRVVHAWCSFQSKRAEPPGPSAKSLLQ
jgi:transcriptional regulator with XRE-family HTH domain